MKKSVAAAIAVILAAMITASLAVGAAVPSEIPTGADLTNASEISEETTFSSDDPAVKLLELLSYLGVDLTPAELYDLVSYVSNDGKLDDWLKANKGIGIGSFSIGMFSGTINSLVNLVKERVNGGETTTEKYRFTPPARATTTVPGGNEAPVTATKIYYPDSTPDGVTPGDVDMNGKVNAKDARLALRASAKLETLTAKQTQAADVNGDGSVRANDARKILRFSALLIPTLA